MKTFLKIFIGLLVLMAVLAGLTYRPDIPLEELKLKYTNDASKFITIDGMEVHYRDEGSGFPLVLLHGTASSLHTWDGWTQLMTHHFRVIRLDLPGFGLTGPDPHRDYAIHTYVNFLNDFLQKLQVDSFYLAGNSLGGQIAWNYALAYPEKVRKMILLDAAGYPKKAPMLFRMAKKPWFATIFKNFTPKYIVVKNLKQVYGVYSKISQKLIDRYYELSLRPGNRQAFIDRVSLDLNANYDQIKAINTPTLIQWGESDLWIPLDYGKKFHQDIKGSKLVTYPRVGHVPMEELPVQTSRDALDFLMN